MLLTDLARYIGIANTQGMNQDPVPPLPVPFTTQAILDQMDAAEEAYAAEAAHEDIRLHGAMRVRFRTLRPCTAPHRSNMFKLPFCCCNTLITCSCCSAGCTFAAGQGKEGPDTCVPASEEGRGCI